MADVVEGEAGLRIEIPLEGTLRVAIYGTAPDDPRVGDWVSAMPVEVVEAVDRLVTVYCGRDIRAALELLREFASIVVAAGESWEES